MTKGIQESVNPVIGWIDANEVTERFSFHINRLNNDNIIFSGKFGTGKSTFLRKFFDNNGQYQGIFVSPASYMANNKSEIFQIMKADIVRQLYFVDLDKKLQPRRKSILSYFRRKPQKALVYFFNSISKLAPPFEVIANSVENMDKLSEEIKIFEADEEAKKNPLFEAMQSVRKVFKDTRHFDSEEVLTKLILSKKDILNKEGKNMVLIIDDLDRMLPDDQFYILNILGAYSKENGLSTPLGYDKLIISCDIENLQHSYMHLYGAESSFEGYISKFLDKETFFWDIKDAIKSRILNLKANDSLLIPPFQIECLVEILNTLIILDIVKLRNISKWLVEYKIPYKALQKIKIEKIDLEITINSHMFPDLSVLKLLASVVGGSRNFIKIAERNHLYSFSSVVEEKIIRGFAPYSLYVSNEASPHDIFGFWHERKQIWLPPQGQFGDKYFYFNSDHFAYLNEHRKFRQHHFEDGKIYINQSVDKVSGEISPLPHGEPLTLTKLMRNLFALYNKASNKGLLS